jgi:hypothetical protein
LPPSRGFIRDGVLSLLHSSRASALALYYSLLILPSSLLRSFCSLQGFDLSCEVDLGGRCRLRLLGSLGFRLLPPFPNDQISTLRCVTSNALRSSWILGRAVKPIQRDIKVPLHALASAEHQTKGELRVAIPARCERLERLLGSFILLALIGRQPVFQGRRQRPRSKREDRPKYRLNFDTALRSDRCVAGDRLRTVISSIMRRRKSLER